MYAEVIDSPATGLRAAIEPVSVDEWEILVSSDRLISLFVLSTFTFRVVYPQIVVGYYYTFFVVYYLWVILRATLLFVLSS